YRAFIANKKNEALQSRIIVIPIPYNLRVSDEVAIYEKLIRQADTGHVHIAPHALYAAAVFSVLSRLKEPTRAGMDLMTKLKLYDGAHVEGFRPEDVAELQREFDGVEGM